MIYANIERLAAEKGLSIAGLEKSAGVGNGVLRKWNKKDPRNAVTLKRVADALEVTIDDLVREG